jgi:replication-associated recombination protein RarA
MFAESYRPTHIDDVFGHEEAKDVLREYLRINPVQKSVLLLGTPGIGKTSLVLAAARSLGYEPLEVNASRSLRSYADVDSLRDSCRAAFSIQSLLQETPHKTCVILDEVDGSDPHAQRRILEWIRDEARRVPILMTSNEEPIIFKRAKQNIVIHRCMPSSAHVLYEKLKPFLRSMSFQEFQQIAKECLHDVRRILHRVQYGVSDPVRIRALTGDTIKDALLQQDMFYGKDPILQEFLSIET